VKTTNKSTRPSHVVENSVKASAAAPLLIARESNDAKRFRTTLNLSIENEDMVFIEKALQKARQETGEGERSVLLAHIARAFLAESSENTRQETPYRITIHHDSQSGVSWVEGANRDYHVPASTLERAQCDAEILDLHDEAGCPSCEEVSPKSSRKKEENPAREKLKDPERHGPRIRRSIPPTLRRKVRERDQNRCATPGCHHKRFLSLHHINPVRNGGKEQAINLVTVCSRCHAALHKGKLSVEGKAPNALVWKNRFGVMRN
jgi:5-methylcytosine-specific restriction endonuclease McrA